MQSLTGMQLFDASQCIQGVMGNTTSLRPALTWTVRAAHCAMEILTKQTDARLVTLTLQGDRDAFGELVRRHQTSAYNVARRIVGDPQDALDVTQDAFVRAYDALASFDRRRPFAPWLHTIVANLALNLAQRRRPTESLEHDFEISDMTTNPERGILAAEQQQRVRQALLQLPPAWRAVVELRHFQDMSYQEISDTLNLPVSDVKSHLFRARQKLKHLFEQTE